MSIPQWIIIGFFALRVISGLFWLVITIVTADQFRDGDERVADRIGIFVGNRTAEIIVGTTLWFGGFFS